MKTLFVAFALSCFAIPLVHAQESIGDKAHEAKEAVAEDAREAGHAIKKTAHKVRRAVITVCADGRHTVKGASGCKHHGGVSARN